MKFNKSCQWISERLISLACRISKSEARYQKQKTDCLLICVALFHGEIDEQKACENIYAAIYQRKVD